MIKLISGGQEVKFETTIFPDGTSQVWKVDKNAFDEANENYILWLFENEAELIQVCQLAQLCYEVLDSSVDLVCPYLPYGRQDKEVHNERSFALVTFKEVLYNAGITRIEAFDAHSKTDMVYPSTTSTPAEFHRSCLNQGEYDLICYPDKGAAERYAKSTSFPFVYAEKVRDQLTGDILGLKILSLGQKLNGKRILIVDDICDGGMTFIKTAEILKQEGATAVDLAVSHGLFSKGKDVLHKAGIGTIYTTNSLLRNPDGFKVW